MCIYLDTALKNAKTFLKTGPTRKSQTEALVLRCGTALENLGSLENLNLRSQNYTEF